MKTEWTIRGLEMRRGDWCMLAKKTQEHVIEMIFEGRNRYEILEYLAEIKRNLWAGNFDDMLPITKSVKLDKEAKANTPQLRAFKMLEDMTGTKRSINKVTYLLVKSQAGVFPVDEDLSPELVKSFSYWKSDEMPAPSYKDYWERQVLPPSMRILGVLKDFQQQKML